MIVIIIIVVVKIIDGGIGSQLLKIVRGLEVHVHGCEERLIQAASGDRVDGLEAASF